MCCSMLCARKCGCAMLRDIQQAFRRGVLSGDDDPEALGLIVPDHIPPDRRFGIYRNNTVASLIGVLIAAFPVTVRLVGDQFFRHAARAYVRANPPLAPQLLAYGSDFPGFLAAFEPARGLPYLPDVARLEWLRQEAYFAADAVPLSPASLQAVPAQAYAGLVFVLHPSARPTASRFPVLRIWEANQPQHDTVEPVDLSIGGERLLVLRPRHAVVIHRLSAGDYALVTAIAGGASLSQAAGDAMAAEPAFDLQAALAGHLQHGTFSSYRLAAGQGREEG